jgi:plasmid maintenance system antidote protein VapI
MKLKDWLWTQRLRQTEFAETLGVSNGYMSELCSGQKWPSRDMARRIVEATGGQVSANDFIDSTDAPSL